MDPEVKAMSELTQALEPLDAVARARVLTWANDRYGVDVRPAKPPKPAVPANSHVSAEDPPAEGEHQTLAELFAAAAPKNGAERVLVVGYWLQNNTPKAELTGFEVNKELKHLGHGSKRINNDFQDLMDMKPQLAVQLKKSGKSKQARKTYKLTHAGIAKVTSMLAAGD